MRPNLSTHGYMKHILINIICTVFALTFIKLLSGLAVQGEFLKRLRAVTRSQGSLFIYLPTRTCSVRELIEQHSEQLFLLGIPAKCQGPAPQP